MKKQDIKIGALYKNKLPAVRGVIFRGVGQMRNRKPANQEMIVEKTGRIILGPSKHPLKGIWENFVELEKK
jgi:hypothetical protein